MNRFLTTLVCITTSIITAQSDILTLSEAEHKAVTTGYVVRSQHFEERAKSWEKRNVIAGYLPKVDYNLTYLRMDDSTVIRANQITDGFADFFEGLTQSGAADPGAADPIDLSENPNQLYSESFEHEISLSQPITNGGMEIIAIGIAKNTKKAIDLGHEAARLQAIYDTRKAYFDALTAAEYALVVMHTLSWTKQNLTKSQTRHTAGAVPITDLLQWQADVAQKESEALNAEASAKVALLSLYQSMGIPAQKADLEVRLQPLEHFESWYKKGEIETTGSVKNNPQLLSIKSYTKVAESSKKLAVANFMPKLNGFWSYSWKSWPGWSDEDTPDNHYPGWNAGAFLSVPLFTGLRNSTNYKKTKYEYAKTIVEEQKVENQLTVNLKRIALFYDASYKGVKAAGKQHELMQKQFDAMQSRYDGGLVTQSELLNVELGARQARIGYIQKLFECLLYETEYYMNTGKLEVAQ